ncbi:MFS transporter [Aestuariimicrobium soli]|uniref:MFS transporter n=1 Tax=Aestuariimicrobium soli TaxID=2035834 RepID=UPI003EBC2A77
MSSPDRVPNRITASAAAGLWGLHFAFLTPALAFILVALLDMSAAEMGWTLAIYNAGGFVAALVLPALADRQRNYLRWLAVASVLTLGLVAVLASTTRLPLVVAGLVCFGGPAGVGMSMLYGHLRASGLPTADVVKTRTVNSLAWVIGPPLATGLISGFGNKAVLWAVAAVAVGNLVLTWLMAREHMQLKAAGMKPVAHDDQLSLPRLVVVLVVAAFVLLGAVSATVTSVINLFVVESLHLPLWWAGLALGLAAGLEIPGLLVVGRLVTRFSSLALVASGAVAGMLYALVMWMATGPVVLLAAQVLNAWFVSTISGVGITLFQQMIPRPGLAAGLNTNTRRVGNIISGGLLGLAGGTLGDYRWVFPLCLVLMVLALGFTLLAARRSGRVAAA